MMTLLVVVVVVVVLIPTTIANLPIRPTTCFPTKAVLVGIDHSCVPTRPIARPNRFWNPSWKVAIVPVIASIRPNSWLPRRQLPRHPTYFYYYCWNHHHHNSNTATHFATISIRVRDWSISIRDGIGPPRMVKTCVEWPWECHLLPSRRQFPNSRAFSQESHTRNDTERLRRILANWQTCYSLVSLSSSIGQWTVCRAWDIRVHPICHQSVPPCPAIPNTHQRRVFFLPTIRRWCRST
mmetsp:Transcript_5219/g.8036  ORF Transcript_5219/g.8036 Transcript_5219/m.8036 type:complete len:238 (-) Transcript_5219:602-1315(-)